MTEPYTKHVTYRFEIDGDEWEITLDSDREMMVSETRKNGQEDTHMVAGLFLNDDAVWEYNWGHEQIGLYAGNGVADAILAYINKYGRPEE